MITIDKLCYNSKLRYENAGEKFAFAMITLLFCVMSRSIVVACIVLAVTGILTVYKGESLFPLYPLYDCAAGFPDLEHHCHCFEFKTRALGSICRFYRQLVPHRERRRAILCPAVDSDSPVRSLLPVFSVHDDSHAGHSECTGKAALPQTDD